MKSATWLSHFFLKIQFPRAELRVRSYQQPQKGSVFALKAHPCVENSRVQSQNLESNKNHRIQSPSCPREKDGQSALNPHIAQRFRTTESMR